MLEILNPHTPISALKHPLSEIAALINQKSEFIQATNIRFVDVNYFTSVFDIAIYFLGYIYIYILFRIKYLLNNIYYDF